MLQFMMVHFARQEEAMSRRTVSVQGRVEMSLQQHHIGTAANEPAFEI